MFINRVELHNFRAAKDMTVELHPKMNLVVGVNGAGKTTILQAITAGLTMLIRRVNNSTTDRNILHVSDIHFGENTTNIILTITHGGNELSWGIKKTRPGADISLVVDNDSNMVEELCLELKHLYKLGRSLPVIVYYPVSRVVERNVNAIFRGQRDFESIDIYDNALEGKSNYQNFFLWFKNQDDFINQQSLSRTHWMKYNNPMIRRRISDVFNIVDKLRSKNNHEFQIFRSMNEHEMKLLLQEPRFLFREVIEKLRLSNIESLEKNHIRDILHEMDYMLHKMDILFNEERDVIVESKGRMLDAFSKVLDRIYIITVEKHIDDELFDIVWEMFILSLELGLWWLSGEGHTRVFRYITSITSKFRGLSESQSVGLENIKKEIINYIEEVIDVDIGKRSKAYQYQGRDIDNVVRAIEKFVPEFSNLRINRSERGVVQMLVDKNGRVFDIGQLSDGEKNLIALVGDIARRLTIGNPDSNDPLEGSGVVLIDEIDLHLHPKWQRIVSEKLTEVFPNCQFVISTHSPQVISHIPKDDGRILLLKSVNDEIDVEVVEAYGLDANRILNELMETDERPSNIKKDLTEVFELIDEDKLGVAKEKIKELNEKIGDDSELEYAKTIIKRKEITGK